MRLKRKLVHGVGVNDATYPVKAAVNGVVEVCPFWRKWESMLMRCYCHAFARRTSSYDDCSVAAEWHSFNNFKKWMEQQNWHGNELDKDLLVAGNRIYSPDTCLFIRGDVNKFIAVWGRAATGALPGAFLDKATGKFKSLIHNPVTGRQEFIGRFDDEMDAHLAWSQRKAELAHALADQQSDPRVADALRKRFPLFL